MQNYSIIGRTLFKAILLSGLLLWSCSSSDEGNGGPNNNTGNNNQSNDNDDDSATAPLTCTEFIPPAGVSAFDQTTTFPEWSTSSFNLPYASGDSYLVGQGNTTGFGHSGFWRYGYDFHMNIGTEILAARDGRVVHANDGTVDGNPNGTNLITILHNDGTVALYSHLTLNGVLVGVGDEVNQGDLIGLSGNTGNTGGIPHLHFSLHPCSDLPGLPNPGSCPTRPVTFKNTEANPQGLGTGQCYTAD